MTLRLSAIKQQLHLASLPLLAALGLILSGCASVPQGSLPAPIPTKPALQLHYLGTAGFLLDYQGKRIATAPFISNPNPFQSLTVAPIPERIDARVPALPDVEMVLVGHSHYDHALDLPYLAGKQLSNASFYGGPTLRHLMASVIAKSRLIAIAPAAAATEQRPGDWFYSTDRKLRFMALQSDHAPHLLRIKFASTAKLTEDLPSLPKLALNWPEGETYAYLIDFLNPDGKVAYRVYYQDSASSPGQGHIPPLTGDDKAPVDLAILCAPAFDQVNDYPEHILDNVQPKHVVAGHWEDFMFGRNEAPAYSIPLQRYGEFSRRVKERVQQQPYFPQPGERFTLP